MVLRSFFVLVFAACLFTGCDENPSLDEDHARTSLLSGWRYAFAPTSVLSPEDLERVAPDWKTVEGSLDFSGRLAAGRTLWLSTTLPGGRWQSPAIYFRQVYYKFEAFLGGKSIYIFGNPHDPSESSYLGEPDHFISLPRDYDGKRLYLRVDSDLGRVGVSGLGVIGEKSDEVQAIVRGGITAFTIGLVSILVGVIAIAVYVFAARTVVLLSFGAFSTSFGVYAVCHTKIINLLMPDPLAWDYLQYSVTYLLPGIFVDFSGRILGPYHWRVNDLGKWAYVPLWLGTFGLVFAHRAELPETLPVFQAMLVLTACGLVAEVVIKAVQGTKTARIFAFAAVTISAAAVHDVFLERGLVALGPYLAEPAMLIFIGVLAVMIASQLREDFEKRMNMMRELETAGILQTNFMPQKFLSAPNFSLGAFARAASKVSGDWYSYRLINQRWLQVHVGDVTGHGTKAALVAAFSKGSVDFFYQDCDERCGEKPAIDSLHTLLNRTLFELGSSEATMTLLSLSLDLKTGEAEFVNSGNPSPLVFSPGDTKGRSVHRRNGAMLGFQREFQSMQPEVVKLDGNELIILRSDGIEELFDRKLSRTITRQTHDFLQRHAGEAPKSFCESLDCYAKAVERPEGLTDDITVLALKLSLTMEQRAVLPSLPD